MNLSVVVHDCNFSTLKADTEGLRLEANLSNILRVCLKNVHLSPLLPPRKNSKS